MPIYEYACEKCDSAFEALVRVTPINPPAPNAAVRD